ncbi:MAG: hypothetical protein KVP17_003535 [Porospora cf. gigantea B]|uniref:uncharacterized protein n=2 Tax=Porospora cf. gigantea B TaxID=2853592 RepID=UPI003571D97F|nr:MAG: hypothetical protein KVP17_003535 [Porospora cf. gigantea B]
MSSSMKVPRLPNPILTRKNQVQTLFDAVGSNRSLLIGTPGAFSHGSNIHLSEYVKLWDEVKACIPHVFCITVNDAYVVQAWRKDLSLPKDLRLVSDWSAMLTEALGMAIDADEFQMGIRARRFAVLSEGTRIVWCGVEDDARADCVLDTITELGWRTDVSTKQCPVRKGTLYPSLDSTSNYGCAGALGVLPGEQSVSKCSSALPSLGEEEEYSSDTTDWRTNAPLLIDERQPLVSVAAESPPQTFVARNSLSSDDVSTFDNIRAHLNGMEDALTSITNKVEHLEYVPLTSERRRGSAPLMADDDLDHYIETNISRLLDFEDSPCVS